MKNGKIVDPRVKRERKKNMMEADPDLTRNQTLLQREIRGELRSPPLKGLPEYAYLQKCFFNPSTKSDWDSFWVTINFNGVCKSYKVERFLTMRKDYPLWLRIKVDELIQKYFEKPEDY